VKEMKFQKEAQLHMKLGKYWLHIRKVCINAKNS
jgi:hypothetical protein